MIHLTAKVSEQVNRKFFLRNMTVQLSTPYTNSKPSNTLKHPTPQNFRRNMKKYACVTFHTLPYARSHMMHMQITWCRLYITFSWSKFPTQYNRLSHQHWASCLFLLYYLYDSLQVTRWKWPLWAYPISKQRFNIVMWCWLNCKWDSASRVTWSTTWVRKHQHDGHSVCSYFRLLLHHSSR